MMGGWPCWCMVSLIIPLGLAWPFAPTKVTVGSLQLSPLGIGTWAWGNRLLWGYEQKADADLCKAFDYAVTHGVNWFDTADSYGTGALEGRAETLLGNFLRSKPSREPIYIATKLAPYPWRIGRSSMRQACDASKKRLRRECIDILQLHWPPWLGWQEEAYLETFCQLVQEGSATQIGLSNYGPKSLKRVSSRVQQLGGRVCSNQVQFSLLSQLPLSSGLLDVAKDSNIAIIGYTPLAFGLLTDRYSLDRLPSGPRAILFREFLPEIQPLLHELRDVAKYRRKTVAQVAINWTMCKGALPLVGVKTLEQAKMNIGAIGWSLNPAEVTAIDAAAKRVKNKAVQNIFQTP